MEAGTYWESQNLENWKTTLGLLTDILERMKGHSTKPNLWEILVMRIDLYSQGRIYESKEIGISYVFWDSLYDKFCQLLLSGRPPPPFCPKGGLQGGHNKGQGKAELP